MDLSFPFPEPQAGMPQRIRPGVRLLRMPLPFALDHINLWLLGEGGSWTLVDTGIATDECRVLWQELLDKPAWGDPEQVLVTHFHPDHFGLAGWFSSVRGARILMSAGEQAMARRLRAREDDEHAGKVVGLFSEHGLDAGFVSLLRKRGNGYRRIITEPPEGMTTVAAGQSLVMGERHWMLLGGNGHSPEHICPYDPENGVLISGDQVLPTISSNVSVGPDAPEADPLGDFLSSLTRLRELPADTLVLPSHGLPFVGLRQRIDDLHSHHEERLERIRDACIRPCTAAQLLPVLFNRALDGHTVYFAMGESIAHLHYLWLRGELVRYRDDAGCYRFSAA